jgi:plastocyanin
MFSSRSIPGSRHLPGATWVVIAVLALAACSPSASASSPAESAAASLAEPQAESAAASTAASPSEAAVGGDTTVTISGNSFGGDFTISAGSTVSFFNNDSVGHTVTNGENGVAAADALFDEAVADGAGFEFTFDTPGVYLVTCRIHSTMNLTITVQ